MGFSSEKCGVSTFTLNECIYKTWTEYKITLGDFKTPLSVLIDRTGRQKISKDIEELKKTINQVDLNNI